MTTTARTFICTVDGGAPIRLREGRTVLDAVRSSGTDAIQVGCRGGGCGVCRVRVLDGEYTTKRMSRRFVSEAEEAQGYVLACRLFPDGDLTLTLRPALPELTARDPR